MRGKLRKLANLSSIMSYQITPHIIRYYHMAYGWLRHLCMCFVFSVYKASHSYSKVYYLIFQVSVSVSVWYESVIVIHSHRFERYYTSHMSAHPCRYRHRWRRGYGCHLCRGQLVVFDKAGGWVFLDNWAFEKALETSAKEAQQFDTSGPCAQGYYPRRMCCGLLGKSYPVWLFALFVQIVFVLLGKYYIDIDITVCVGWYDNIIILYDVILLKLCNIISYHIIKHK